MAWGILFLVAESAMRMACIALIVAGIVGLLSWLRPGRIAACEYVHKAVAVSRSA